MVHIHTCKKSIHTHEIINLKKNVLRAKLVVFAYDPNRLEAEAGGQQGSGLYRKAI